MNTEPLTGKDYAMLFDLLDRVVNGDGPYHKRRDALLQAASDDDKANLQEFSSWEWDE